MGAKLGRYQEIKIKQDKPAWGFRELSGINPVPAAKPINQGKAVAIREAA